MVCKGPFQTKLFCDSMKIILVIDSIGDFIHNLHHNRYIWKSVEFGKLSKHKHGFFRNRSYEVKPISFYYKVTSFVDFGQKVGVSF